MSSRKKRNAKGPVEAVAQQTPVEEDCGEETCGKTPAAVPGRINKIALAVSAAMLAGWIAFLAVLALGK